MPKNENKFFSLNFSTKKDISDVCNHFQNEISELKKALSSCYAEYNIGCYPTGVFDSSFDSDGSVAAIIKEYRELGVCPYICANMALRIKHFNIAISIYSRIYKELSELPNNLKKRLSNIFIELTEIRTTLQSNIAVFIEFMHDYNKFYHSWYKHYGTTTIKETALHDYDFAFNLWDWFFSKWKYIPTIYGNSNETEFTPGTYVYYYRYFDQCALAHGSRFSRDHWRAEYNRFKKIAYDTTSDHNDETYWLAVIDSIRKSVSHSTMQFPKLK